MWFSKPRTSCRCDATNANANTINYTNTNVNANKSSRNHRNRKISSLQGKGIMFLALVFFTESITVTNAVRTVEAYAGSNKPAKTCTGVSSATCVNNDNDNHNSNNHNNEDVHSCCLQFERCAEKHPRALETCGLIPRGGDAAATVAAGAAAAAAATATAAETVIAKTPYNIPLNGWKIIFQAVLTTINVVCWLVPLKSKSFGENKLALSLANAFSGGVFLSLAFGHLIPECVEGFSTSLTGHYNEAAPYMLVLSGYLLIFFVEKVAFDAHEIMHEMEQGGGEQQQQTQKQTQQQQKNGNEVSKNPADAEAVTRNTGRSAVILLAALAVHSILEMMALGLSDSFSDSAILTISIALHQPAESIALLVAFLKSGMPKGQIITFLSAFSAMGPIGVALGMAVNEFAAPIVDAIMLAVVAGTFVYVGATEVIPEEFEDSEHKWKKFLALIAGIGSIFAITQYTMTLTE